MSLRIMCHHHTISDTERELIERKIDRLRKYYDRITEASVILDAAKNVHQAEILLSGPHLNLRVMERAGEMRTAFAQAVNTAKHSLKKSKERIYGNKKHPRRNVTIRRFAADEIAAMARSTPDDESEPRLAPIEQMEPKPMSLEEAHLQLEARDKEMMVFLDAQTHKVNIIHRNGEGRIELVELDETAALEVPERDPQASAAGA